MAGMKIPRALPTTIMVVALLAGGTVPSSEAQQTDPPEIEWREWNDRLFRDAADTGRYVLLDLSARWCHWCHFMEERTYAHPAVRELVNAGYLAVRVDQDANPDLSSRYGDWGWPATIIFGPQGDEVAKLQGFQRPSRMVGILHTILAEPGNVPDLPEEPDVMASQTAHLTPEQREHLVGILDDTYDEEFAGWGRRLKFLQADVIDYALTRARNGDREMEGRLRRTLDAALGLLDPVWGGTYQYSHERDWSAPHYEKIMAFQANGISLYARAHAQFGDPAYLEAAESIASYLMTRLRDPDGAFYTSQDADVNLEIVGADFYGLDHDGRIQLGLEPTIDTSLYSRENGWAATGLLELYAATGDSALLDAAQTALEWVVTNRSLPGGGFSHGTADRGGPFLSDNVAMGEAMLKLYMADGDAVWLERAARTADFIAENFRDTAAGFATTHEPPAAAAAFSQPFVNIEENIELARFANLLSHTSGAERFASMAQDAMKFLTGDSVVNRRRFLLGIVLADEELSAEPAHIAIVGARDDPAADALHRAALQLSLGYVRIDRWDPQIGPMPNPNVEYPEMDRAAAYACANNLCSLPVFVPEDLGAAVVRTMRRRHPDWQVSPESATFWP